ncbi:MAG: hypothetical protein R3272_00780 [Candidatus Promineifilaceae bacterium]|nr:hypothetical protein [Candidatus Promineifilaceae bacterium]
MRPVELLILLAILPSLLLPILSDGRRFGRRFEFPALALILVIVHLVLEGYRWQMVPAYLLALFLFIRGVWWVQRPPDLQGGRLGLIGSALLLLLYALAVLLPLLFPVPDLPEPEGQFPVGTTVAHLVDRSRPEIYSVEPDDVREIMFQVWYPVAPHAVPLDSRRAPYLDRLEVAGPAVATRLGLPPFLLDHVDGVRTHSIVGAAAAEGPFPLLIFSHGLRGLRGQNTVLMETLASHGYIVASIDHAYGNVLTVFPDERIVFYEQEMVFPEAMSRVEAGARLVDVWAADVVAVVEEITAWHNTTGHTLSGRVAQGGIGTLGHSTGGGTAVEACVLLAQCAGVVALDPWMEPVSREISADGYDRPLLIMRTPEWLGPDNVAAGMRLMENSDDETYTLTIAGAGHFDFSDLPLLSPLLPYLGLSGSVESERVLAIINSYTVAFFDHTLKGAPAPAPGRTTPAYPEISFSHH